MIISHIFKSEQIREQKRNVDRSVRIVDREKRRLEADEKKMKMEIKKLALNNQHVSICQLISLTPS